jgi:hypothetical protein
MKRSPSSSALLWLAIAVCGGGCGGGSGTSGDPFVGTWKCTGTDATSFSQPPNTMPVSETNGATVVITDDGTGRITRLRTPDNGAPQCTLHSTLGADQMSFTNDIGESCMTKNGGTITYKTGGAKLTAAGYNAMSTWTFTGKTAAGADLVGDGTGSSMCVRM